MLRASAVCAALALGLCGAAVAQAAGPPQIGSTWTSGVGTSTAGLRAEISPASLTTTYHFSYITNAVYEANLSQGKDGFAGAAKVPTGTDPGIGAGAAPVTLAQAIGALSPHTAYRYRVQASNTAGTDVGPGHIFTTEAFAGASSLLDGRSWELVSPVDKNGGQIQGFGKSFGGGVIQAAAAGSTFTYSSIFSFGADTQGAPGASQYMARRGIGGWKTENITATTVSGAYGGEPDGVPYQLFSTDLARGFLFNGKHCVSGESCSLGYSLRESADGAFAPSPEEPDLRFVGAAASLGHIVLSTCAALTPNATEVPAGEGCDPSKPNLYKWSEGELSLLNILPAQVQGSPGAAIAAQGHAVSIDGKRIYWSGLANANLYLREAEQTQQVDAAAGGGGTFQTAADDGSIAYFTKSGHLWRYLAVTGVATDLADEVQGVLGASEDGAYVYYLTSGGLFLSHGATASKVAATADASNFPPSTGTARVTPNGMHLAFLSKASLTGYDNREEAVGAQPVMEVFIYNATASGTLICASCNPTGERPRGPSSIPGAIANGIAPTAIRSYQPRALSDDGRRLFFDSTDELALADTAKRSDVYEWEDEGAGSCGQAGGCIALISRGRNSEGASFLDASASGTDVFFLTDDSLVDSDLGSADIYDAREGGGFPEAAKPIECVGDSCQFLPSEPDDPTPGTVVPSSGNPPLRISVAARGCKKGFVRKQGKCVRKLRRHRQSHQGPAR